MYARNVRRTWPIVYGRRRHPTTYPGVRLAWALFLGLGFPFVLMALLTVLARAGVYLEVFRPLWQPWPPDLLKPFLGLAVFATTLAYLAYRVGLRSGFRSRPVARAEPERAWTRNRLWAAGAMSAQALAGVPPPPPPDELTAEL